MRGEDRRGRERKGRKRRREIGSERGSERRG